MTLRCRISKRHEYVHEETQRYKSGSTFNLFRHVDYVYTVFLHFGEPLCELSPVEVELHWKHGLDFVVSHPPKKWGAERPRTCYSFLGGEGSLFVVSVFACQKTWTILCVV